jgi:hypothetical protein
VDWGHGWGEEGAEDGAVEVVDYLCGVRYCQYWFGRYGGLQIDHP